MVTATVPGLATLTGDCDPSRSPLCGMAFPEAEMRAPIVTWSNFDSVMAGDMASESSSVTVTGRSLTC